MLDWWPKIFAKTLPAILFLDLSKFANVNYLSKFARGDAGNSPTLSAPHPSLCTPFSFSTRISHSRFSTSVFPRGSKGRKGSSIPPRESAENWESFAPLCIFLSQYQCAKCAPLGRMACRLCAGGVCVDHWTQSLFTPSSAAVHSTLERTTVNQGRALQVQCTLSSVLTESMYVALKDSVARSTAAAFLHLCWARLSAMRCSAPADGGGGNGMQQPTPTNRNTAKIGPIGRPA